MKGWRKTTRGLACAACGDMDGYCSVSDKGDVCICRHGVVSNHPHKQKDGVTVYIHPMDGAAKPQKQPGPKAVKTYLSEAELAKRNKAFQAKFIGRHVTRAAESLGLSEASLRQYGCGYDADSDCLTFPMYCGDQKMIGIRTRHFGDAVKRCVTGSRNGLFIPAGFDVRVIPDSGVDDPHEVMVLASPEGPTDAAACHACGFVTVGMPNNDHGGDMLARLLRRCADAGAARELVTIEDVDTVKWAADKVTPLFPGRYGALVRSLPCVGVANAVRIVPSPRGKKDMRKALNDAGGDTFRLGCELATAIGEAPVVTVVDIRRKLRAIEISQAIVREMLAGRTFPDDAARDAARADALREAKALVVTGKADGWLAGRKAVASAA